MHFAPKRSFAKVLPQMVVGADLSVVDIDSQYCNDHSVMLMKHIYHHYNVFLVIWLPLRGELSHFFEDLLNFADFR